MKFFQSARRFLPLAVLILLIGGMVSFALWSSQPMSLRPEELTPVSDSSSPYPGTELSLEMDGAHLLLTFINRSDAHLTSGASVRQDKTLHFSGGLQVLLDGQWYFVPHKDYATAGVGLELGPGDSVSGEYSISPIYGRLPDGQYRLPFHYWRREPGSDAPLSQQPSYISYASFIVSDGQYVLADQNA